MIHTIPRWIKMGFFILPAMTGILNSTMLLSVASRAVSFLTGDLTDLLVGIGSRQVISVLIEPATALIAFAVGAFLSGILIGNRALHLGRRYGIALMLEALLILFSYVALRGNAVAPSLFLAGMACGLQNAMITTYSKAIIRTVHFTGIISDMGAILGQFIGRHQVDWRQFKLLCLVFFGYVAGVLGGTVLFPLLNIHALLIPVLFLGGIGFSYFYYRTHRLLKKGGGLIR